MLNARQAEIRRTRVGASEVAGLLGMSDFTSPQSVYDRIVYGIEDEPNEAMRIGLMLEPHAAELLKMRGIVSRACHRSYVHPWLPLCATPDLYVNAHAGYPRGLGEFKTSSAKMWGDDVPPWWMAQIQTQLLLGNRDIGWLVVLNGSRLTVIAVEPDKAMQDIIEARVYAFYKEHLEPGIRPDDPPILVGHKPKGS
jgi:predicted phage-related endonuclease